jgi:hypothetical protein
VRDPAHVLFDHACDLLVAGRGLAVSAHDPGAAPAMAATLGCIESTLDALVTSVREMSASAGDRGATSPVTRQLDDLAAVLARARDVAGGAREATGPVMAERARP